MKKINLIFILIITLLVLFSSTSITYGEVSKEAFWERMALDTPTDELLGGAKKMLVLNGRVTQVGMNALNEGNEIAKEKAKLTYESRSIRTPSQSDTALAMNSTILICYVYQSILPDLDFTNLDSQDIFDSGYWPDSTHCNYFYSPHGQEERDEKVIEYLVKGTFDSTR